MVLRCEKRIEAVSVSPGINNKARWLMTPGLENHQGKVEERVMVSRAIATTILRRR